MGTLRDALLKSGFVSEQDVDRVNRQKTIAQEEKRKQQEYNYAKRIITQVKTPQARDVLWEAWVQRNITTNDLEALVSAASFEEAMQMLKRMVA